MRRSNLDIIYGVPQGLILELLLFIIYEIDFCSLSKIFVPIIFKDDTNLFFSNKNIKELFNSVNLELNKTSQWFLFKAYKLINKDKTKYTLSIRFRKKILFH